MDAIPTDTLVFALIVSLSFIVFRRLFAWRQAWRDKTIWGLDDDRQVVASTYAVIGWIGAFVSAFLLAIKLISG